MRTIKFRLWNHKTQKFLYSDSIDWCGSKKHSEEKIRRYQLSSFFNPDLWDSDDVEIQQFTGLLDSKGKEIYEGDIAFYDPEPNECFLYKDQKDCLISWKDDETSHGWFISSKNGRFSWRLSRGFCKKSIVIIGNIFEHPHLLS